MTETLLKYVKSKTRVLVTHALDYLKYVDKILIMEQGEVVEQGNYEQIKNGTRFKAINESMMKNEEKKRGTTLLDINALDLPEKDQLNPDE